VLVGGSFWSFLGIVAVGVIADVDAMFGFLLRSLSFLPNEVSKLVV
jgi:hypothetical protein